MIFLKYSNIRCLYYGELLYWYDSVLIIFEASRKNGYLCILSLLERSLAIKCHHSAQDNLPCKIIKEDIFH